MMKAQRENFPDDDYLNLRLLLETSYSLKNRFSEMNGVDPNPTCSFENCLIQNFRSTMLSQKKTSRHAVVLAPPLL